MHNGTIAYKKYTPKQQNLHFVFLCWKRFWPINLKLHCSIHILTNWTFWKCFQFFWYILLKTWSRLLLTVQTFNWRPSHTWELYQYGWNQAPPMEIIDLCTFWKVLRRALGFILSEHDSNFRRKLDFRLENVLEGWQHEQLRFDPHRWVILGQGVIDEGKTKFVWLLWDGFLFCWRELQSDVGIVSAYWNKCIVRFSKPCFFTFPRVDSPCLP